MRVEKGNDLLAAGTGIVYERVLDRLATIEKVDQNIDGYSGAYEHGSSAEDLGGCVDDLFQVHLARSTTRSASDEVKARQRPSANPILHRFS